MKNFVLSVFQKIANTSAIQTRPVQIPNSIIETGIINDDKSSFKQVDFLKLKLPQVHINESVDSSYAEETGRGKIVVPDTKDFYLGEVL